MLCDLAESYVHAINSNAIPTISSAWERVIDGELRRIYDAAMSDLEFYLKQIISQRFPIEQKNLMGFL